MDETLFAGASQRLEGAQFHLERMDRALIPLERTRQIVVQESAGAVVYNDWQPPFYANFGAFIAAGRSVPAKLQCSLGVDPAAKSNPEMKDWFKTKLTDAERNRRQQFDQHFEQSYKPFRALALSKARITSEHRSGLPPVLVRVRGRGGSTYSGGPDQPIPIYETCENALPFSSTVNPIRPTWNDFTIEGRPLLEECRAYLGAAQRLMKEARRIATHVHGVNAVTPPPP